MAANRRKPAGAVWYNWLLFLVYLGMLCYFLFFAEIMGRTANIGQFRYNLVPLREIRRFLEHADSLGWRIVFLNIYGNVLAFVPFGYFVPNLFGGFRKAISVTFVGFLFSFVVEVAQLFFYVGSFDVDDILLNTIGAFLGYIIYFIFCKLRD